MDCKLLLLTKSTVRGHTLNQGCANHNRLNRRGQQYLFYRIAKKITSSLIYLNKGCFNKLMSKLFFSRQNSIFSIVFVCIRFQRAHHYSLTSRTLEVTWTQNSIYFYKCFVAPNVHSHFYWSWVPSLVCPDLNNQHIHNLIPKQYSTAT